MQNEVDNSCSCHLMSQLLSEKERDQPNFLQQILLLAAIIISPHYLCSSFPVSFNLLRMHSFTMRKAVTWAGKCFGTVWTLVWSCPCMLIDVKLYKRKSPQSFNALEKHNIILLISSTIAKYSIYCFVDDPKCSRRVIKKKY